MQLTKQESEMLDGKYGYPVQKAMQIQVALGECYGAERLIPITSAHSTAQLNVLREAGVQFIEDLANKGGKFAVHVDTNPIGFDPAAPYDFGLSEAFVQRQKDANAAFARMGAFLAHTCAPYLIGHLPRWREHVAWNESSAVNYVNSLYGVRTNREGGPSSLAAALTGRVPEYGYHLDENRRGDLRITVTAQLNGLHDYGALGYFTGMLSQNNVPVFVGIPSSVSLDDFKNFGGAAQTGDVQLYHVVGITPEAPTEEAAFGGKKVTDSQSIEFGERQLRDVREKLSSASTNDVDVVGFGCPHLSIREIREIARLIAGRKVRSGVRLLITTSRMTAAYARYTGDLDVIEASGGRILSDTCLIFKCRELFKEGNPGIVATSYAKAAIDLVQSRAIGTHYGSIEECVEAAVTGKWRS